jgi:hypothetical protein
MKMGLKPFPLALISLILTISCKKLETASNNNSTGCISDATVTLISSAPLVTQAESIVIDNLYRQNNLSTANLQFFSIDSNTFQPPGFNTDVNQYDVLAYRWYNNLPLFNWNDNVVFYNGVFQPQASIVYGGDAPGPDTTYRQTLESLRTIWLNNFMKVGTYYPLLNDTNPRYPSSSYRDSCLIAKRGYIDAGVFQQPITNVNRPTKAWTVTPENGSYPMVIISDSTGAAWPINEYIP